MTAAGVQNIDSASYVPAPPSTSTSDARGAGTAGKQPTDAQSPPTPGEPSDFHSELALQQSDKSDKQDNDSAAKPVSEKPGAGKSAKKRDAQADDANASAPTPVQVAEPQKQILPLLLMVPQTNEL